MSALRIFVLVIAGTLITSCAPASADARYTLSEFSIDGAATLQRQVETLTAVNEGEFGHTLVVTNDAGEVVAATDLIAPGSSVELAIDLPPGTYRFTCRIVAENSEGELVDHFEAGMNTEVRIDG